MPLFSTCWDSPTRDRSCSSRTHSGARQKTGGDDDEAGAGAAGLGSVQLLIVNVTDVDPCEYCEVAAAVAMTVQTPFPPTTMVLSPSTRQ
jgi:hypothetical protein